MTPNEVEVVVELESPSAALDGLPRSQARLDLDSRAALRRRTRIGVEQEHAPGGSPTPSPCAGPSGVNGRRQNALRFVVPAGSFASW